MYRAFKINFVKIVFLGIFINSSFSLQASLLSKETKADFENAVLLNSIFDKLYSLTKNKTGKINIVHIGDSHIQADFFTNTIRQNLQKRFGNGGYGFTFPYTLAKTNGSNFVKYTSNIEWDSRRNIYPVTDVSIGLSGIGLYTRDLDFKIDLKTTPEYAFSKIKLLYPTQDAQFKISLGGVNIKEISHSEKEKLTHKVISTSRNERKRKVHIVKPNETLYRLSVTYKVTVDEIKKANNLTSNTINVGKEIIIPVYQSDFIEETKKIETPIIKVEPALSFADNVLIKPYCSTFTFSKVLDEVSIVPNNTRSQYDLSGIVLENDQAGVIYHSIGVNGTKASDYNKYPLFFEQLPDLHPDLIIISLGTNEAFGKWSTINYINQMKMFISRVKVKNPNAIVLLMTPPPSLFKRKNPNTLVADYGQALRSIKDCVIWDLLDKLGGVNAPNEKELSPLMAKDKVHFTRDGYEVQGEMFSSDFLSNYDNYIKNKNN